MDNRRKVIKQIQPLNEEELETDLKFLLMHHSDTAEHFVQEAIPVIKYHLNLAMADYQEKLLENLTWSLKGEIAGIILRTRRDSVYDEAKMPSVEPKTQEKKGAKHDW